MRGAPALWIGLFTGPFGWWANTQAEYLLASDPCNIGFVGLWSTALLCVVVALTGTIPAVLLLREPGRRDRSFDLWTYLAYVDIGFSTLFALIILMQAIALSFLDGCQR